MSQNKPVRPTPQTSSDAGKVLRKPSTPPADRTPAAFTLRDTPRRSGAKQGAKTPPKKPSH